MAKRLAIIRGHGDKERNGRPVWDAGRVSVRGLREADVTLIAAHALERAVHRSYPGAFKTIIIRGGGRSTATSLIGGCRQLNTWGADLSVSIHCNGAASTTARGQEIWHCRRVAYQDERLARLLNEGLHQFYFKKGIRNRGLKTGKKFTEIWAPKCHAALVELGFLSNVADARFLENWKNIEGAAQALAHGINWFVYGRNGRG